MARIVEVKDLSASEEDPTDETDETEEDEEENEEDEKDATDEVGESSEGELPMVEEELRVRFLLDPPPRERSQRRPFGASVTTEGPSTVRLLLPERATESWSGWAVGDEASSRSWSSLLSTTLVTRLRTTTTMEGV